MQLWILLMTRSGSTSDQLATLHSLQEENTASSAWMIDQGHPGNEQPLEQYALNYIKAAEA